MNAEQNIGGGEGGEKIQNVRGKKKRGGKKSWRRKERKKNTRGP